MYAPRQPSEPDQPWAGSEPQSPYVPAPSAYPSQGAGQLAYIRPSLPAREWLRIPTEKPILTPAILAVLAGIFVLMSLAGRSINATENDDLLVKWGAKVGLLIYHGEWWRLITATFLHAGFLHIALNGYALFMIGTDLESFMGRARFAAIYIISGLAGSVASFAFMPLNVAGVGASGAIFGLVGALGVYFGLHRKIFGRRGQLQFWNIVVVIVLNIGLGLSGIFPIDNSAHLGGLIAGAAVGYVLCPRYKVGEATAPGVRELVNVNRSLLSWVATALIALNVVAAFFVALLLFKLDILLPR